MSNVIRHFADVGRGPSPAIWRNLGKWRADADRGKCSFVFDDMLRVPTFASATEQSAQYTYQDTGVTIQGMTTAPNLGSTDALAEIGVLEIAGNDADNDEGHWQAAGSATTLFRISNGSGNTGVLAFEARIRKASIADNGLGLFIGMGSPVVAANYLVDDTAALVATEAFIGFNGLLDDGDKLDTIFQEVSQTQVVVEANAATVVAGDYINLGFRYNPNDPSTTKKIRFYVNGVETATGVSTAQIDAATFPEDTGLVPLLLTKVGTAAEVKAQMDFICYGQYLDSSY